MAARYRRSALGMLWSLINPLVQLLVFVFLFQSVLKFQIAHYPVYVFCALLAWNWFNSSLTSATYTLYNNRDLMRKPAFPTELLAIVSIGGSLVNYLAAIPLLVGFMLLSGIGISAAILAFPAILIVQFLFTCGLCWFVSILNVYYRDVEQFVFIGLGFWFYMTPIFYQTNGISSRYHVLYELNPMAQLMGAYRGAFGVGTFPGLLAMLGVLGMSTILFLAGLWFFKRFKDEVIDEL